MALGGDVDDAVDTLGGTGDVVGIGDIAMDERVARVVLEVAHVLGAPGVRQQVDVDDMQVGMLAQQAPHEVRANEAAAAGDEDLIHAMNPAMQAATPARHGGRIGVSAYSEASTE